MTWQEVDVLEERDRALSESTTSSTDLRQERESPWLSGEEPAARPRPGGVYLGCAKGTCPAARDGGLGGLSRFAASRCPSWDLNLDI